MSKHSTAAARAAAALGLLCLTGCGGPRLYPVSGKVVFEDGDVKKLVDGNIEFQLDTDSKVRSYGAILDDGRFTMETQHDGRFRPGVWEGTYQVRIFIPPPPDGNVAAQARRLGLDYRFMDFKTSGMTCKVPADGDVTLAVRRSKAPGANQASRSQ